MWIFLRNRVFRLRQKYPLANFRVELFSCLANEHPWWISLSINSAFSSFKTCTVPPIASWQCTTNDWRYVLSSEPQKLRQALTSSMSIYIDQSAIGGEKEGVLQVSVCIKYYRFRGTYTFLVCGGDVFQYRFNVKNTRASSFYVYAYVEFFYTRFNTL